MRHPPTANTYSLILLLLLSLFAAWLFPNRKIRAATVVVTSAADSGTGSLRAAIAAAAPGDVITFGTIGAEIRLTSGGILIDKSLTIMGSGTAALSINGDDNDLLFRIAPGATVTLTDLTLAHGRGTFRGAGIYSAGTLVLNRVNLSNHKIEQDFGGSAFGGGVYNDGGLLLIDGCSFFSNRLEGGGNSGVGGLALGAGIFSNGGQVRVANSTFTNNQVLGGNAVGNSGVPGDGGDARGSAIYAVAGAQVSIYNSTIAYNYSRGGDATGGGSGPSAGRAIGAVAVFESMLSVASSTVVHNAAEGGNAFAQLDASIAEGGGLYHSAPLALPFRLKNSIVALNEVIAGNPRGIAINPDIQTFGPISTGGYNIVGIQGFTTGYGMTDMVGTESNPLDPLVEGVADNGGQVQTIALQTGPLLSPAVDAANPAGCTDFSAPVELPLLTDGRGPGFVRIFNGRCDIGAFEVQLLPTATSTATMTSSPMATMVTPTTLLVPTSPVNGTPSPLPGGHLPETGLRANVAANTSSTGEVARALMLLAVTLSSLVLYRLKTRRRSDASTFG